MTVQTPGAPSEDVHALVSAAPRRAHGPSQTTKARRRCCSMSAASSRRPTARSRPPRKDYLSAFNADPQFREPLESLVRHSSRAASRSRTWASCSDALPAAPPPRPRRGPAPPGSAPPTSRAPRAERGRRPASCSSKPSPTAPRIRRCGSRLELCAAKEGDMGGYAACAPSTPAPSSPPTRRGRPSSSSTWPSSRPRRATRPAPTRRWGRRRRSKGAPSSAPRWCWSRWPPRRTTSAS